MPDTFKIEYNVLQVADKVIEFKWPLNNVNDALVLSLTLESISID